MPLEYKSTKRLWKGEPIGGIRHPRNIEKVWTDDELSAIGLQRVQPPPEKPEAETKRRKRAIREEYHKRLDAGIVYNSKQFLLDTHNFSELMQMTSLAIMSDLEDPEGTKGRQWAIPGEDFTWETADGTQVPMTAKQVIRFSQLAVAYKMKLQKVAKGLIDISATDPSDDKHWPSNVVA